MSDTFINSSSDQDSNVSNDFTEEHDSFALKSSNYCYKAYDSLEDDLIAILTNLDDHYESEVQIQQDSLPPIQSINRLHPPKDFPSSNGNTSLTSTTRRTPPPPYQDYLAKSEPNKSIKCER